MATIEDARRKLPLDRLMGQYGFDVPPSGTPRKSFRCPLCDKKGKATLRENGGRLWFKCFNTACRSGTAAPKGSWDEVRFYGWQHSLNSVGSDNRYSEAAVAFMKEAGVWQEYDATSPSTLPGQSRRRKPTPKPPISEKNLQKAPEIPTNPEVSPTIPEVLPTIPPESGSFSQENGGNVAANSSKNDGNQAETSAGSGDEAAVAAAEAAADRLVNGLPAALIAPPQREVDLTGVQVLREFYAETTLQPQTEDLLFRKRGLTTVTCQALGVRSNPSSNRAVIERLLAARGEKELVASGLMLAADRKRQLKRRINSQFHGKGQVGKIPKAERKHPEDKIKWGWSEPPLIPYFDEAGALIALRPHKGGAPAWSAAGGKSLYIPRLGVGACKLNRLSIPMDAEKFTKVIITEGEFKAMALWQTVGLGSRQFTADGLTDLFAEEEVFGVCAVPGISYAKHFETREALEDWLRVVGCREVIVAFDFEEKGDANNFPEAYEKDLRKRYDTQIYARYLATALAQKLHIIGKVCVLPRPWLNAKGKADWDGELAEQIKQVEGEEEWQGF